MKKILFAFIIISVAAFAGSAWYSLSRRVQKGERHSPYSTYRSDGFGCSSLSAFCENAGLDVNRLKYTLHMSDEKGLLFIIEPENVALTTMMGAPFETTGVFLEQEIESILKWVGNGNTLVLATSVQSEFHERLGIKVEFTGNTQNQKAGKIQISSLSNDTESLSVSGSVKLFLESPSWVGLFALETTNADGGHVVAAVRRFGAGRVVCTSDPFVFTNRGLSGESNARFAANVVSFADADTIYFDEYHHGIAEPRTLISYLKKNSLHFALLQLLGVFVVFIWASRSRFGKPLTINREIERGAIEYVRAFSLIYKKAYVTDDLMLSAFRLLKEKLAVWLGIGRSSSQEKVFTVLKKKNDKAAKKFGALSVLVKRKISGNTETDFLGLVRLIANFEKEFLSVGKRTGKT